MFEDGYILWAGESKWNKAEQRDTVLHFVLDRKPVYGLRMSVMSSMSSSLKIASNADSFQLQICSSSCTEDLLVCWGNAIKNYPSTKQMFKWIKKLNANVSSNDSDRGKVLGLRTAIMTPFYHYSLFTYYPSSKP